MTITFNNAQHRELALKIAHTYEQEQRKHLTFYTPKRFEQLPTNCQQEHADIAHAAMNGTTYRGMTLPEWVTQLAQSVERKQEHENTPKQ
ncbi:hypothetical protein ACL1FJ_00645 [Corynebacterium striatum]